MQRLLTALISLCALITAQPSSTFASILYDQPFNYQGDPNGGPPPPPYGWQPSVRDPNDSNLNHVGPNGVGNYQTAFDDFEISNSTGATITEVQWTGLYYHSPPLSPLTLDGWTVAIWSDSGNKEPNIPQPNIGTSPSYNSPLYTVTITNLAAVHEAQLNGNATVGGIP